MLLTGNYRCVTETGSRPIREAVLSDPEKSRAIYDWVGGVAQAMGADDTDQVPFEKYASAAEGLLKPSSAARAIDAGAPYIERADRLVQAIAKQFGLSNADVDAGVAIVDQRLDRNRAKAA